MQGKARILVVDDEAAIRALVAKIVERAGFPVDSARDGAEAIEMVEAQQYAVLVVDLMMPNVDGFALLDYLKARGGKNPAIIVISAGDSSLLRMLDGSMVHSIVRKPFDIDVLGDLIAAAARTMEQPSEAEQTDRTAEQRDVLPFPNRGHAC